MKKNFALLFISIVFCFGIFEAYLWATNYSKWIRSEPGQFKSSHHNKNSWSYPHKIFGWTFNRSHPVRHRSKGSGIDVVYTGNRLGFRDSQFDWASDISPDENNIVVFGDSMVFGFGVEEEDRISNQLAKLLDEKYKVYNIAVPGWGFDQMMLAFKRYAPEIRPKLVIFAFINDDLHRAVEAYRWMEKKNKPSYKIENGSLKLRSADDDGWFVSNAKIIFKLRSINYFYKTFYRKYLTTTLNKKIAEEIIETGQALGIKTMFVRIPEKYTYCLQDDTLCHVSIYLRNHNIDLSSFFKEKNQIYINQFSGWANDTEKEHKKHFFPLDGHINKIGHRIIAENISEKIKTID